MRWSRPGQLRAPGWRDHPGGRDVGDRMGQLDQRDIEVERLLVEFWMDEDLFHRAARDAAVEQRRPGENLEIAGASEEIDAMRRRQHETLVNERAAAVVSAKIIRDVCIQQAHEEAPTTFRGDGAAD